MYDDLRKALADARPAVAWFALGEAIKLTGYIDIVVPQHRQKATDKTNGNLLKVAKAVVDFLQRHSSAERDVLRALQQAITTIEMEV